ncbi:MAG: DNA polymerase III subunit gamma/tau [Holosporales bacterium]|jgi:DNA polymerase-3 subunit gamma/tau|nr:DNA polymerase III subunit gamma/tau [Holosporales bacterium]
MSEHYVVLSRRYRPKNLGDLIGHEVMAKSVGSCLMSKKIPHAFLLHGMHGVGKTTTARIIARCLSCTGNVDESSTSYATAACGKCRSCLAMDMDNHMDVMEIDAASRTGVDDIREIIDASQYMPVWGRHKIFIIDEAHMLSKSAFNALLKTLEEPPGHVKFILATTEVSKIPDTILSRCMVFRMPPVSTMALLTHVTEVAGNEGYTIDEEAAKLIVEEASGSVRDGLSILEQAMMLTNDTHQITYDTVVSMLGGCRQSDTNELISLILKAATKDALKMSEKIMANGGDPFALYKNLQSAFYKLITETVATGGKGESSLQNLLYLWQILLKQTENMKSAANPEYVLNATIVILAYTASFPNIGELMLNDETAGGNTTTPPPASNDRSDKKTAELSHRSLVKTVMDKFSGAAAYVHVS